MELFSFSFENDDVQYICEQKFSTLQKIMNILNDFAQKRNHAFSVYFVSNETIRQLNKQYRFIDKVTDVLSFPLGDDELVTFPGTADENEKDDTPDAYLGEIIVACNYLKEKAETQEEKPEELLLYMILHSYLHLLGMDHGTEEEYNLFEKETEELLRGLDNI